MGEFEEDFSQVDMQEFLVCRHNRDNYDAYGPLDAEDKKEWDAICHKVGYIESMQREVEAQRSLFWVKLERKLDMADRDMRIESGILYVEKKG